MIRWTTVRFCLDGFALASKTRTPAYYLISNRRVVGFGPYLFSWLSGSICLSLKVVHGSLFLNPTRRRNTLTRPDQRLLTKSLTRSDPTWHLLPIITPICTMFHEFKIHVANREHYCCMVSRETVENISLQVLYCFLHEGEKTRYRVFLFFTTVVSRQPKWLQISDVSKMHSGFNLSKSKFWSLNSFYPARFKQTSRSSRPDEFNIASTSYQPAIVILIRDYISRTDKKSLSDWAN